MNYGALDVDKHIDLEKEQFLVERTLKKDKDGKIVLSKNTKTGKKKLQKGKKDERYVPFNIFDKDIMVYILKKQKEVAKNNPNNKENLLFCKKDGSYIDHKSITNIFKRVCRECKVAMNLPTRSIYPYD